MTLDEGVDRGLSGDTYPIYGFLPNDRKYRKKDIEKYEAELIQMIDDGQYTKLGKCPMVEGKRQMYVKL